METDYARANFQFSNVISGHTKKKICVLKANGLVTIDPTMPRVQWRMRVNCLHAMSYPDRLLSSCVYPTCIYIQITLFFVSHLIFLWESLINTWLAVIGRIWSSTLARVVVYSHLLKKSSY